ncbi:glutamine synthetase family protein [Blastococcus sp. TF02A-26]|uniref:glutamine synthetase family protein n=1 Tax=Blastococcus sp. TF02A-26 TaxID=2250577 RepID=UPI000DEAB2E5|nr:glutamine synthetase family protein [Blastococcus sp. TF02A-26]RBY90807.1 glutamine synthetase [Blastococcus sp. TF02A-26]
MSFVEEHGGWDDGQREAARQLRERVDVEGIEAVRVGVVDLHGLVRGKTVMADQLPGILAGGLPIVSTLLSKDTSGRTVYGAFAPDGGVGVAGMGGAGDVVMVPDPTTFRVLPWAPGTGWLLSDLRLTDGAPVPFDPRGTLRAALARAAERDLELVTGLELEFHLLHVEDGPLDPAEINRPGAPGRARAVSPVDRGYQLLSEDRADALEPFLAELARTLRALGIPLRTVEVEFGPGQVEVTTAPLRGLAGADAVVLLRSAVRSVARRAGLLATFMCRPQLPEACSSGWHLHQSLEHPDGGNAFVGDDGLSEVGRGYLAGLLRHARAGCVFAVPTVNGYKRFQPFSMAPDRVLWAHDNRAAMLRVVGSAERGDLHVENRAGEPAANPYLAMAAQLVAGLDGVDRGLDPGPSADQPYATEAPRLPTSLTEAVRALDGDTELRALLGPALVDHYAGVKRAEVARFEAAVTDWEQREYLHLF